MNAKRPAYPAVLPIDVNTAESVNVADNSELLSAGWTSGSNLFAALSDGEGYAVAFDLGIEGGVFDAEQPGRARLIAAGSHQGCADEVRFELPHFVVKLHFVIAVVGCGATQAIDYIEELHGDIAKR